MKKYIFIILAVLTGTLTHAQSKVGTIDVDYILGQMPGIASVEEGLNTYNTKLQEDLQGTIKNYEGLIEGYRSTSTTLSEEDKATKENEIISLENDIKNFRQKASVLMQMRRNELTKPLYEKIEVAMKQVISEQKYTQIINSSANALAFSDPAFDITDAVLKQLGITITQE